MTRSIFALSFVSVLALAGCKNPAADVPSATVTEPSTAGAEGSAAAEAPAAEAPAAEAPAAEPAAEPAVPGLAVPAGSLALSPANTRLAFVGSKVTASHEGGWERFSGVLTPANGGAQGGSVSLELDMSTIFADRDRLTQHLRSDDFFSVANHPTARFTSSAIAAAGPDGAYVVTGTLEIKGIAKEISFPATITVDGNRVSANAEFSINRQEWGINYTGMPDDLIRDEVVIRFAIDGAI